MKPFTETDNENIWHPFTQMQIEPYPVVIKNAKGSILTSDDNKTYIDAISSWWVNLHGHCHPDIAEAIFKQAKILDQVIFAGFSHPSAIEFSSELLEVLPGNSRHFKKIFFSDNGSTAVEVGLKMAVQYWHNKGIKKNTIIAFEHSYHGDTFGSMSVSERGAFTLPFYEMLFNVEFLPSPALNPKECLESLIKLSERNDIAALVYEPLVQGAGGMLMYPSDILEDILGICKRQNILMIADEVMTGFGRTGKLFASEFSAILPDIICLSKGITGGTLPMAVTVCTNEIYNAFLSDQKSKALFHGHSYTGNALSIAAARASLKILKESLIKIQNIENSHKEFILKLQDMKNIKNVRNQGTILAFDIITEDKTGYFHEIRDKVYQSFLSKGVLLRPLGNTVYILPPYCISERELNTVYSAIIETFSGL